MAGLEVGTKICMFEGRFSVKIDLRNSPTLKLTCLVLVPIRYYGSTKASAHYHGPVACQIEMRAKILKLLQYLTLEHILANE